MAMSVMFSSLTMYCRFTESQDLLNGRQGQKDPLDNLRRSYSILKKRSLHEILVILSSFKINSILLCSLLFWQLRIIFSSTAVLLTDSYASQSPAKASIISSKVALQVSHSIILLSPISPIKLIFTVTFRHHSGSETASAYGTEGTSILIS